MAFVATTSRPIIMLMRHLQRKPYKWKRRKCLWISREQFKIRSTIMQTNKRLHVILSNFRDIDGETDKKKCTHKKGDIQSGYLILSISYSDVHENIFRKKIQIFCFSSIKKNNVQSMTITHIGHHKNTKFCTWCWFNIHRSWDAA